MHSKQEPIQRTGKSTSRIGAAIGCATLATLMTTCAPVSLADVNYTGWHATSPHVIDHLVIIAIDGVRWQEVFRGVDPRLSTSERAAADSWWLPGDLMPNVHRIAQTRGMLLGRDESKVFVSNPSTVSLPGYSELFGGRTPKCSDNDCRPTEESTFLDDWHRADPSTSMAIVSSWSRIPRVAARDGAHLFLSAGSTQPQNFDELLDDVELREAVGRGLGARPAPGTDDYRPDRYTAEVGIRLLETLRPGFLFLGLGDTDEHAHLGNYGAYLTALHGADAVVGRIDAWLLAQQRIGKRTLLIVTTDHGRAATFQHHGAAKEAARIWALWSGDPVLERGYPAAADSRLADLAPTIRQQLGLTTDLDVRAGRDRSALIRPSPRPFDVTGIGPIGAPSPADSRLVLSIDTK